MNNPSDAVTRMGQVLLDEARQEAAKLLAEAQEEAKRVEEATEQEAERVLAESIESGDVQTALEAQRCLATADLAAARILTEGSDDVLAQCFSRLESRLQGITQLPDYLTVLSRLVSEAGISLQQSEIFLKLCQADQKLVNAEWCRSLSDRLQVSVHLSAESAPIMGGVVVQSRDGHLRYDQSFETLLSRHRDALRSIFYQTLWESRTDLPNQGRQTGESQD